MTPEDLRSLIGSLITVGVVVMVLFRERVDGRMQWIILLCGTSVMVTLCLMTGDYVRVWVPACALAWCAYRYNQEWRRVRRLKRQYEEEQAS